MPLMVVPVLIALLCLFLFRGCPSSCSLTQDQQVTEQARQTEIDAISRSDDLKGSAGYTNYIGRADEERRLLGLRTVDPSWVFQPVGSGERCWKNGPDGEPNKIVYRRDGKLLSEWDYYYSGRTCPDHEGGSYDEMLYFVYEYTSNYAWIGIMTDNPHVKSLVEPFIGPASPPSNFAAAVEITEKVLSLWGVSRLGDTNIVNTNSVTSGGE